MELTFVIAFVLRDYDVGMTKNGMLVTDYIKSNHQ